MKWFKVLFAVTVSLLLGACANLGSDAVSFQDFRGKDEEAKADYLKRVKAMVADKATYDLAQNELLHAGLPVRMEIEGVLVTKIWDGQTRRLQIYDGYVTSAMGSESLLLMSILTEENSPKPLLSVNKTTNKPEYTVLAGNVSVNETMGRVVVKALFGVGTAAVNGYFAAAKTADGICKGDCGGNITMVNTGGNALAGSTSQSQSGAAANLGATFGCSTGNCQAIPLQ